MAETLAPAPHLIAANVAAALAEDIATGDITAALIDAQSQLRTRVITRQAGRICGIPWFDETLRQVNPEILSQWHVREADDIQADQLLCDISGPARAILSAERTALNFLQLLSGAASQAARFVNTVAHTSVILLDTRKTIPGLRLAQKYAARCGGFQNHRMGLYDQFLIKENHIHAAGSISAAVSQARQQNPARLLQVEVEDLDELKQTVEAGADRALLDNFTLEQLRSAVSQYSQQIGLEASGGVNLDTVADIAATGVHFISVGQITKEVQALDLSMRFISD